MSCPKKWALQYRDGHKVYSPSIHTVFGTAIHETLQHYLSVVYNESGAAADRIDLETYFEEKFREVYSKEYQNNKKIHFSDLVTAATLNMAFEELEVTAMGDTARQYVKGLETATLTLSFLNDPATNEILDELLSNYGTTVGVKLIQDAGTAVADGNKLYTFDILFYLGFSLID